MSCLPPVQFLFLSQFVKATAETGSITTADYVTTLGAFPFYMLFFQEFGESTILDEVKVFNQAHPIIFYIPFINLF